MFSLFFQLKRLLRFTEATLGKLAWHFCKFFNTFSKIRNRSLLFTTSVFWPRVRARALRAPVFLGSLTRKKGRCAPPPRPSQLRCFLFFKNKNNLFPETKCFPSGPNSGRQGRIFFHWAKLHPTELHCTLLSYAATSWATLCPILSYPAPNWAKKHHTELCCIQLSYLALRFTLCATLHPTELSCALLSYAAPFWAMLHTSELCCTLPSFADPSDEISDIQRKPREISRNKCISSGPNSGCQGHISFHCTSETYKKNHREKSQYGPQYTF